MEAQTRSRRLQIRRGACRLASRLRTNGCPAVMSGKEAADEKPIWYTTAGAETDYV